MSLVGSSLKPLDRHGQGFWDAVPSILIGFRELELCDRVALFRSVEHAIGGVLGDGLLHRVNGLGNPLGVRMADGRDQASNDQCGLEGRLIHHRIGTPEAFPAKMILDPLFLGRKIAGLA